MKGYTEIRHAERRKWRIVCGVLASVAALCLCAALFYGRWSAPAALENTQISTVNDRDNDSGNDENAQIPGLRAPAPALDPETSASPLQTANAPAMVPEKQDNPAAYSLAPPAKPETPGANVVENAPGATGADLASSGPEAPIPARPGRAGLVERGDTAASLLQPYLNGADIDALTKACAKVFPLTKIRDDRRYEISFQNGVLTFEYEINPEEILVVRKTNQGFTAVKQLQKYEVVVDRIQGDIVSNLFHAVEKAGERPEFAIALADIFAWEVDFIRDIRVGDSFKAVVEKRYREGRFVGYGRIFAAEFVNQGDVYQGFLFHYSDGQPGYYDSQGNSLRKAFLRAPLKFSRISSGFSKARMHPILNIVRPHFGVDYAAPLGTAVKTVGDGVVFSAGWRSGGGKTVHVKHANGYETMYMHLSRYGTGIKNGKHVKQGEVIGYVGMTGLATGSHLDFRLEKDNKFINPNKLDNPRGQSLPAALLPAFHDKLAAERERLERPSFAQEKPNSAAPPPVRGPAI